MISIAQQIAIAGRYSKAEAKRQRTEANLKAARQAETRAKQWASRKAGGNGVSTELLARLPESEADAITLAKVKQLLAHMDVADSSISGAISIMVKDKTVARTGERRDYRYYLAKGGKQ